MAQDNANTNTKQNPPPAANDGQAKAPAKAPDVQVEKFFMVKEDREIPRHGSTFLLKKGKRISSKGYPIEHLKRIGVKLEELPASA